MEGKGIPRADRVWRDLSVIFLLALAVRVVLALPQQQPNYFDAYYYYNVAENLQLGRGFTVDFIWNYLDAPPAVTHPSNLYWTPLSSMLAWFSMALFGVSFRAAQIPFVLLSTVPPLLAYTVSWRVYSRRDYARLAAILTAFAPFYLRYWACPDNFAPFAASAGLSLLTMFLLWSKRQARYALLTGLLMGLSHLSRADGVLLWLPFGVFVMATVLAERRGRPAANLAGHGVTVADAARWVALALAGYLA
ncbi:MAG: glycosyltransferase family 39 protein, partial [Anaerolineae bacterium]|nr:glycosyltransferase family 39 protein [Anaerolineae bacterium]